MFYFSPALDTSFRGVTRGAFILAGCFLYENTPIGRQAPLSDTIHCTCIDMKSVLTSTEPGFFCGGGGGNRIPMRDADPVTKLKEGKEGEEVWRDLF